MSEPSRALQSGTLARVLRRLALVLIPAGLAAPLAVADDSFQQCVAGLESQAVEAGIAPATARDVLGQVQQLERVLELDRRQPEFTQTFTGYFDRRVSEARVQRGRELLREHRELLERVQQNTGVPGHYLLAFWALETNFGSYFGSFSVPDALATLACDPRRSDFFTSELIAALRILDSGDISLDAMKGSWAGAMGHVQFMPSVFLQYAVDGDGTGRRDLWGSIPDAMTSAGNFLEGIGWRSGQRWGREVTLPDGFAYDLAGLKQRKPLAEWAELGVRTATGAALPQADLEASLLVPSGHRGPAFLVYDNFRVIMRWNRSEFFALTVGHLADRIAGAGRLQQPPPEDARPLARAEVQEIQARLDALGFEPGGVDGIFGPATRAALSRFQREQGLVADGHPDPLVIQALLNGDQEDGEAASG